MCTYGCAGFYTNNFLFLYWLICFFCLLFWLMLISSWVQEKLSPQQERQKDHQVHVRGEEEWNVRHGWRAHVRGSRPVPQAKGRQTQAGGASRWVKRNWSSQTLMSLFTSHTVAVIRGIMKDTDFNENPHCHIETTETIKVAQLYKREAEYYVSLSSVRNKWIWITRNLFLQKNKWF